MPNNQEVRLLVKKETFTFRLCSKCSGTCKPAKRSKFSFNDTCGTCHGTGKERFKHITEISLLEALKELNLIK